MGPFTDGAEANMHRINSRCALDQQIAGEDGRRGHDARRAVRAATRCAANPTESLDSESVSPLII
jgi:hypothetical protein